MGLFAKELGILDKGKEEEARKEEQRAKRESIFWVKDKLNELDGRAK